MGLFAIPVGLLALAGAVIEVVRRGGWPPVVGGIALSIASAAIAFLGFKTIVLILQKKLLLLPVANR